MSERDEYLALGVDYLIWGDLDKPFHLCECECEQCEEWRRQKGRPTHAECRTHIFRDKNKEVGRERE